MSIPKVFISYSHDSLDHKKWVLELAIRLRNNGIDAILDQWDLRPGDDIPIYMEENLSNCDFTLMICTTRYVEKANEGRGGVGYEKMIVTSQMIQNMDERKFIPIVRQTGGYDLPIFLKTKLFLDFSKSDDFEFSFDNLLRALHKAPILTKPKLGTSPFTDKVDQSKNLLPNHALEILKVVVGQYEKGQNYVPRYRLHELANISRIYADVATNLLCQRGYIILDKQGDLVLTDKGKFYAIENDLAKK